MAPFVIRPLKNVEPSFDVAVTHLVDCDSSIVRVEMNYWILVTTLIEKVD